MPLSHLFEDLGHQAQWNLMILDVHEPDIAEGFDDFVPHRNAVISRACPELAEVDDGNVVPRL